MRVSGAPRPVDPEDERLPEAGADLRDAMREPLCGEGDGVARAETDARRCRSATETHLQLSARKCAPVREQQHDGDGARVLVVVAVRLGVGVPTRVVTPGYVLRVLDRLVPRRPPAGGVVPDRAVYVAEACVGFLGGAAERRVQPCGHRRRAVGQAELGRALEPRDARLARARVLREARLGLARLVEELALPQRQLHGLRGCEFACFEQLAARQHCMEVEIRLCTIANPCYPLWRSVFRRFSDD
mmetsp:Transcript_28641/g.60197  ORF Transcript_28641/g.60197 Transcript_28641/m.60197 type:complete len:244 (-) Transcript_28641:325-1056(-)